MVNAIRVFLTKTQTADKVQIATEMDFEMDCNNIYS